MKTITIFIILILVILSISLIYFQSSLTKSKITSSTVKTPTGMITEKQQQISNTETIEEKEEIVKETSISETFLTNAKCIDGKEITFTLNNIVKKEIEPSKLVFYAAGRTIRNPVCDKQNINPGESTNCKIALNFKFNKVIAFTISYPGKSQTVNVNC